MEQVVFTDTFRRSSVMAYRHKLVPAVTNLVWNATQWYKSSVVVDAEPGAWLVSDDGPGVPELYHDAVFEPTFTTRPGGRGIGLYLVRNNLESMGMSCTVGTGPLSGATFVVTFPE
jgi:signal transduction histidine kinase